jgi:hypothetical protein
MDLCHVVIGLNATDGRHRRLASRRKNWCLFGSAHPSNSVIPRVFRVIRIAQAMRDLLKRVTLISLFAGCETLLLYLTITSRQWNSAVSIQSLPKAHHHATRVWVNPGHTADALLVTRCPGPFHETSISSSLRPFVSGIRKNVKISPARLTVA